MPYLIGRQQLGKFFQDLGLHHFQVTDALVSLIGNGRYHEPEHGIIFQSFKLIVVIALPPDIDRLKQQLLRPLPCLKYGLFHSL